MRKQQSKTPVIELFDVQGNKLYVVTDRIAGNIYGKVISASRGDKLYLSIDVAKVFKDHILEI